MSLQPGFPAVPPVGMAVERDADENGLLGRRTVRDADGSTVGASERDADVARSRGPATTPSDDEVSEQVLNEDALNAYLADRE